MRSTEDAFDSVILAEYHSEILQLWEDGRQSKRRNNLRIKFARFGVYHAGRGGVGIRLEFHTAWLPGRIFGDHRVADATV